MMMMMMMCLLEFPSTDMILPSQETVGNCIWLQLIKIRTKTVNSFSIIIELLTSAFIEFYLKDRLNQPAYIENPCISRNSRITRIYEDIRGQTITLFLFVVAAVAVAVFFTRIYF